MWSLIQYQCSTLFQARFWSVLSTFSLKELGFKGESVLVVERLGSGAGSLIPGSATFSSLDLGQVA